MIGGVEKNNYNKISFSEEKKKRKEEEKKNIEE